MENCANSHYFKRGLTVFNHVSHVGSLKFQVKPKRLSIVKKISQNWLILKPCRKSCKIPRNVHRKFLLQNFLFNERLFASMLYNFICSTKVHRLFPLHQCSPILFVPVFKHRVEICRVTTSGRVKFVQTV